MVGNNGVRVDEDILEDWHGQRVLVGGEIQQAKLRGGNIVAWRSVRDALEFLHGLIEKRRVVIGHGKQ